MVEDFFDMLVDTEHGLVDCVFLPSNMLSSFWR